MAKGNSNGWLLKLLFGVILTAFMGGLGYTLTRYDIRITLIEKDTGELKNMSAEVRFDLKSKVDAMERYINKDLDRRLSDIEESIKELTREVRKK